MKVMETCKIMGSFYTYISRTDYIGLEYQPVRGRQIFIESTGSSSLIMHS
jgi:hypothetical protein